MWGQPPSAVRRAQLDVSLPPPQGQNCPQPFAQLHRVELRLNRQGIIPMNDDAITISPGPRFRTAMILAVIADALQLIVFPVFVEGAISPADDILDFCVGAAMINLLGWHWEFLPTFLGKLVPGVDLVPLWTMAVANVYRKSKRLAVTTEESRQQHPKLEDPQRP
jgi:hypothetical protein